MTEQLALRESQGVTDEEYFSRDGLSDSGMRDLMVSPLRFWYNHLRPDRVPEEPTPQMVLGSVIHCLVLEGEKKFEQRYARKINPADYPDLLTTIEDIRKF